MFEVKRFFRYVTPLLVFLHDLIRLIRLLKKHELEVTKLISS